MHDALVHEHERAADIAREQHLVRDQQQRHAVARQILDHLQHLADELGVERRGDLVAQPHFVPHGERAGDGDTLLPAARELARIAVDLVGKADLGQHCGSERAASALAIRAAGC